MNTVYDVIGIAIFAAIIALLMWVLKRNEQLSDENKELREYIQSHSDKDIKAINKELINGLAEDLDNAAYAVSLIKERMGNDGGDKHE